jgi:two-component system, NarL family, nitrate/nitrite response regulator NarL
MPEKTSIHIVLIDDHPLVSAGINTMLKAESWMQLIATLKSAKEAIDYFTNHSADIVLLDISLPDEDGISLCKKIKKIQPEIKIIGLSSASDPGIINALLLNGAHGYLLKNMERIELIEAIEMVLKGKLYFSTEANNKLLERLHQANTSATLPLLTRREKEVLLLLSNGLNGPAIAEKLFLSPFTVETHRKNMMQKFNVHNTQQLINYAKLHHLI